MPRRARVYVAEDATGRSKVGRSRHPVQRAKALAYRLQCAVTLRHQTGLRHDAGKIEREVHNLLSAHDCGGEWFAVLPEEAIEAVRRAMRERVIARQEKERAVRQAAIDKAAAAVRLVPRARREPGVLISIRLGDELRTATEGMARRADRSLNYMVKAAIREFLARHPDHDGEPKRATR